MRRSNPVFSLQMAEAPSTAAGAVTIVPLSRALTLRFPFAALVWNRPTAVRVEQGGQVSLVPIVDVTRIIQVTSLGLSLILYLLIGFLWIRRKES